MRGRTAHLLLQHLRQLVAGRPAPDPASDRALVERFARRRNEAAFVALVQRHGPMVLRVGQRLLHDAQDAEDVFQGTFLVLARKAGAVRWRESIGNWLYGVAYRLALRARAAAARRRACESRVSPRQAADPLAEVSVREAQAILDVELARLPERYRAPLVLCCLEGRTRDEAARQLGWSPALVKSRLEQARERLRDRLGRRGLTLPAALAATLLTEAAAPAVVPAGLVQATAGAALALAAGTGPASGPISARVAALVEGGVKAMSALKLRMALAVFLAGGLAALNAVLLTRPGRAELPAPAAQGPAPPPPAAPATGTDRLGDPLPPGALARIGTSRLRPFWGTGCLAFSPDGKLLVSGDEDILHFWDTTSGREIRHFNAQIGQITVLAFSPTGEYLAAGAGGSGKQWMGLWDVRSGKALPHLKGQFGYTRTVAFSPDGKTLASGGYGNTIHLWDVASGREVRKLYPPGTHDEARDGRGRPIGGSIRGTVELVRFAPNGRVLLSYSRDPDRGLAVLQSWDLATGRERGPAKTYPGRDRFPVLFSPDGRLALLQRKGRWVALDLESGKEGPAPVGRPRDQILGFSPDGKRLASWGEDRRVRLWDRATARQLLAFRYPAGWAPRLAFTRDGKRLAVAADSPSAIRFWDLVAGREVSPFGDPGDVPDGVSTLAFAPDGRTLLSGSPEGRVHLWTAATGKELRRFAAQPAGVATLFLSSDGKTLATVGKDNDLWLWELPAARVKRRFGMQVGGWEMSPRGETLAYADGKGAVVLVEAATGHERCRLEKAGQALHFSPDGRELVTVAPDATLCLWDVASGRLRRRLGEPHGDRMFRDSANSLSYAPDGKALAVVWTGHFKPGAFEVWDLPAGRRLPHFEKLREGLDGWVNGTGFSADGRIVYLRVENQTKVEIRAFDLFTARRLGRVAEYRKETTAIRGGYRQTVFPSPDGRTLATLEWGRPALVWDVSALAGPPRPRRLAPPELAALWSDLGGADLGKTYAAMGKLLGTPDLCVPFFRDHLRPVKSADPRRLRQLLTDLESARFSVRQAASRELAWLGPQIEPALRARLRDGPPPETRQRIERLLGVLSSPSPGTLRALRAVQVLERIGTPEARRVLQVVGRGPAAAPETRAARAALKRLAR